jgi:eukaryotic translation initiation factor 2C
MDFFNGEDRVYNKDPHVIEEEARKVWARGGRADGSPWHPNMDDKMFWV